MQGFRFTSPLPVFWCTFSALKVKSYIVHIIKPTDINIGCANLNNNSLYYGF